MIDIETRKIRLRKEIEIAEKLLLENIDCFSPNQYLIPSLEVVPNLISQSLRDPADTINKLDTGARFFLDEENPIRELLKYAKLIMQGFKQIQSFSKTM